MPSIDDYSVLLDLTKYGLNFKRYFTHKDYLSVNWANVFKQAKAHRISAITYVGLSMLIQKIDLVIDPHLLTLWQKECNLQKVIDFSQHQVLDDLEILFNHENIYYCAFKGFSLKKYYPKSYMREMGDLDFYFESDKIEHVVKIMQASGYTLEEGPQFKEINFSKNRIVKIEIHPAFFFDPLFHKFNEYFTQTPPLPSKKADCYTLTWEITDYYLYLFCHTYKHIVHGGIGIRTVLDLWLFEKSEHQTINWKKFQEILVRLDVWQDYLDLKAVMVSWFDHNEVGKIGKYESFIFHSGVYGVIDHRIAIEMTDNPNPWKHLFQKAFPSSAELEALYPKMKKVKLLLPYYWTKRFFQIIIKKPRLIFYEIHEARKKKEHPYK